MSAFKKSFVKFCKRNKFEINNNQLKIIELLNDFFYSKRNILDFFSKKDKKKCIYLYGDVGVGKTMLFNFFFNYIKISKKRLHFNEFMIQFHNFRHNNKEKNNVILSYVSFLKKKIDLLYLDEFQVTNIVDAMILGKLFETIFKKNIKVLLTSNTKIDDLYKDGLQREQFLPFISVIKKNSIQKKLSIGNDYRKLNLKKLQRTFYPLNEKSSFKINVLFRKLTKDKIKTTKKINVKGRVFTINDFYEGYAKFNFDDLCNVNIGAEDYIMLAKHCTYVVIEGIPSFSDINTNQQLRFITLIDILYEKRIPMMISSNDHLKNMNSSKGLEHSFKRSISRLYELTSL